MTKREDGIIELEEDGGDKVEIDNKINGKIDSSKEIQFPHQRSREPIAVGVLVVAAVSAAALDQAAVADQVAVAVKVDRQELTE